MTPTVTIRPSGIILSVVSVGPDYTASVVTICDVVGAAVGGGLFDFGNVPCGVESYLWLQAWERRN